LRHSLGKSLGVKTATIEYRAEGKRCSIRLGDIAEAEKFRDVLLVWQGSCKREVSSKIPNPECALKN
jgi:hypothetical protein